ncbi:MAG TPA: sulfite exporter TauE/SafE family protein [Steroidobacteraceae bacterium]|nr:sulfite exporter TauE/SafE family protein [Steroidobacteraceae bacterium]
MSAAAAVLLALLVLLAIFFAVQWFSTERKRNPGAFKPTALTTLTGFVTNFFDTLGIGSFAPTTAIFKLSRLVPDERIPGTLNVGHAFPTVAQALIFIVVVQVDPLTLVSMIAAAVAGAWIGAGVVAGLPRRPIQLGMGIALLVAAAFFVLRNLEYVPGGDALELRGGLLAAGIVGNFVLGALMMLGVGLYAPCMALVGLLGMNPIAAFPIMMGSCAFLMPVAGLRFVATGSYDWRAALGLAIGGVPAVLIAGLIVKELPVTMLRWLVVIVVVYTAVLMLYSAMTSRQLQPAGSSPTP